jgi:DNA topoisomerase-6 subunit A
MLKNGYKMELEALSNRGLSFVTEEYLPQKIRDKEYLD